jgi:hypothetical protein
MVFFVNPTLTHGYYTIRLRIVQLGKPVVVLVLTIGPLELRALPLFLLQFLGARIHLTTTR